MSNKIPSNINSVARPDHRSSASSRKYGSVLLEIGVNGPYAYLIRQSNRRLAVVLGSAVVLMILSFLA